MNLGAKGPREPLVGWQERLVFTFPQWDCDGWDEIPPFLRQHPPVPQEWAGALAPSFLWEALLPHPMQSGSWTRSLWNSRKLGLKGDLRGHSSPSPPPDRLILSFSHHRRPSEFSPRPRILSWCLFSNLAITGSTLPPLEAASIWRFGPHTPTSSFQALQIELSWALAWMGCGSWVFKRTGARGAVCLGRLEVRTGSLSTAELCLGLGHSEPDCLREGNLSDHCLPCGSLVLQGRRRSYISTIGSPSVIEEGPPSLHPISTLAIFCLLGFLILKRMWALKKILF